MRKWTPNVWKPPHSLCLKLQELSSTLDAVHQQLHTILDQFCRECVWCPGSMNVAVFAGHRRSLQWWHQGAGRGFYKSYTNPYYPKPYLPPRFRFIFHFLPFDSPLLGGIVVTYFKFLNLTSNLLARSPTLQILPGASTLNPKPGTLNLKGASLSPCGC